MKKAPFIIAISALLLAGAAAFFYCRSNRIEKPFAYHESWAPKQRADLELLRELMLADLANPTPTDQRDIEQERQDDREILVMLRRVAESGKGDIYTAKGFSAAHLAAHQSMSELLRELVLRGVNPNTIQHSSPCYPESVFQTAICCAPAFTFSDTERLSQQERLEQLDWLLAHGADVNLNSDYSLLLALIADVADDRSQDEDSTPGATIEWLLDHGLTPQSEQEQELIRKVIFLSGSLSCVQRLAKKGYLDLQDTQTLNALLKNAITIPESEDAAKARWLLSLGAEADSAMPTCTANIQLYGDSGEDEDNAPFNAALQVLDVLLDYGAELQDPAGICPKIEPQKSAFLEILDKHKPAAQATD